MNYFKYEVHAIDGPSHRGNFEASFMVAMLFLDRGWSCQFIPESLINKLYSKLKEKLTGQSVPHSMSCLVTLIRGG